MIKILAQQFTNFIELVSSKGKIETCLITITQESMSSRTSMSSDGNTVKFVSDVVLYGSMYDYKTTEENIIIPVKDTKMLINVLKNFGNGEINVSVDNNYLIIEGDNSKAEITIASMEYIRNNVTKPIKFEFDKQEVFNSSIFKKVHKHMIGFDSKFIEFNMNDGVLNLIVEGDKFDKITEKVKCGFDNGVSKFDKIIGNAIDCIDGDINFSMGDDMPIKFEGENDGIQYKYYVMNCE